MKACHNCMHWPVCNMREDDIACGYYKPQEKVRVKPMTNADRYRSMSNEEMAKMLADAVDTGACNDWGIPEKTGGCNSRCYECILEHLNSPVEEG